MSPPTSTPPSRWRRGASVWRRCRSIAPWRSRRGGEPRYVISRWRSSGAVQIELIAPAGEADEVYRDMLPPDGGMRLHHIGCLVSGDAEWDAVLADAEASGVAMPVRGDFGGLMRYVYLDRRAEIGHFVEYMQPGPAGLSLFEAVPRF